MRKPEGARVWLIGDAYLPAEINPELPGHEATCVLNTSEKPANVVLTFYFEDRDPIRNVKVLVGPERTLHIRLDKPEMLGGMTLPRLAPFAIRVESDIPIVVQHSRLDVTQPNLSVSTSIAYPLED
jgi:hypothetical protein